MARILIVDDDAHIVRVLTMWLERHGHDSITACNGADALEVVERDKVDLIITDMNMPVLDGLGLAEALRDRGHAEIPLILLTARCDQEKLAEQMNAYRVCVYPKPFFPSKLVAEIDRLLGPVPT